MSQFGRVKVETISFDVPALVYGAVEKRAKPMNVRVAEYARRLFEAAWAARVADERGQGSDDLALDRQVKQVFLMSDCEPDAIATALGIPEGRVRRIIEAWRNRPAWERFEPPKVPVGTPPPPAPAQGGRAQIVVSDRQAETIQSMWSARASVKNIAGVVGLTERQLDAWLARNRDVCPARPVGRQKIAR
jgi:hypothetical protein